MKKYCILMTAAALSIAFGASAFAQARDGEEAYPTPPEAKEKPGVKYGEWIRLPFENSQVYPGTRRDLNIYVPAEYDGKTPACVLVIQDGGGWHEDKIISNMIAAKEIPVMISVAITPGYVPGIRDPHAARQNRTYEYDTPSPRYADFVLKEVLPFVETLKTSDGRRIKLSKNGNDRMIAGFSSGAAAAFNAAWAYPEEFTKVMSGIGSYTGLRGSFENSTLVHKVETKPIRLWLQSGQDDMWTAFGDWWSANNAMVRALDFAGYDYKFSLGTGSHSGWHAVSVFPEAMRYFWKDWPNPIKPAKKSRNHFIQQLVPGDSNYDYAQIGKAAEGSMLVSDGEGGVFVSNKNGTQKIGADGRLSKISKKSLICVSADRNWLVQGDDGTLSVVTPKGDEVFSASEKIFANSAAAMKDGGFFVSGSKKKNREADSVWHIAPGGKTTIVDKNLKGATIGLCPNEDWLYTFESGTRRGFSSRVEEDNSVKFKQEFFFLHVPDEYDSTRASSVICDRSGITFVATTAGIQACDYNGRSTAIFPLPNREIPVSIAFGGDNMDTLYILTDKGSILIRKLNVQGASVLQTMPEIRVGAG